MTADQARELAQLEIWKEVGFEIDKFIAFEEVKLRQCRPEELIAVQDKIKVYEAVKNLPQHVIDREE